MQTLLSILPIFLIVVLGYFLRKTKIAKNDWVVPLNSFVYYVALPALIVKNISNLDWKSTAVLEIVGWNVLFLLIASVILVSLLSVFRISKSYKSAIFLTAIVSNSVYLGYPLVSRVLEYGVGSEQYLTLSLIGAVQLVVGMVLALIVIEFFYTSSKNTGKILKHISKNPLVIASIVGVLLSLFTLPYDLKKLIDDTLGLLALTASPLALFALGDFLSGHKIHEKLHLVGFAVILKMIALPVIAIMLFDNLVHVDETVRMTSILLASMPTAVTAFVIAESYKLDTTFVGVVMLITTVLSLPALTVLVGILK